uniref:G-protein coupled receptors family 1 profile domain-containing protein n=1 Tax=Chaetoceros debilis TaxID=122233 RepID=A0A7S3QE63_9STRA
MFSAMNSTLERERFCTNSLESDQGNSTESIFENMQLEDVCSDIYLLSKKIAITKFISSSVSIVASLTLIWIIKRSFLGFSTTFHRLLFGLCIADLMLSSSSLLLNVMSPSDTDYVVWNARGNQASCDAQGFLSNCAFASGVFYNCSLALHSLAVVRYEKSEEYIRKKLEPLLHGLSIALAIFGCSILLHFEKFNPGFLGFCGGPSYNPGHCIGYDDGEVPDGFTIPCGRGNSDIGRIWYRSLLAWVGIAPLIIIGTSLTLVYKSVLKNEEKMSRYGRGSLRIKYDVTQNNKKEPSKEEPQVGFWMRKMSKRKPESTLTANAVACSQMKKASRRRRKSKSDSRMVLYKAAAYSIAYLITWSIIAVHLIIGVRSGSPALRVFFVVFIPLQGLFNLIIFMYPRVLSAKSSNKDNLTWRQAVVSAFKSRGEDPTKGKRRGRRRSSNYRDSVDRSSSHSNKAKRNSEERTNLSPIRSSRGSLDKSDSDNTEKRTPNINWRCPLYCGFAGNKRSNLGDELGDEENDSKLDELQIRRNSMRSLGFLVELDFDGDDSSEEVVKVTKQSSIDNNTNEDNDNRRGLTTPASFDCEEVHCLDDAIVEQSSCERKEDTPKEGELNIRRTSIKWSDIPASIVVRGGDGSEKNCLEGVKVDISTEEKKRYSIKDNTCGR